MKKKGTTILERVALSLRLSIIFKRLAKVLVRLRVCLCAGLFEILLVANSALLEISRFGSIILEFILELSHRFSGV